MARERREVRPECGLESGWEGEARLGAEVAPREEEEDDLRALDVLLERPNVFEIIYLRAHRGASEGMCVCSSDAVLSICVRQGRS